VYRFLLTRRWLGLIAAALVVSTGCVLMGWWQIDRLSGRHERNDLLERSLAAEPVAPEQLLDGSAPLDEDNEYRRVELTGRYDVAHQLLARTRPYEGRVGYYVLTPLVPESGPAMLVNRGWVPTETTDAGPEVPEPPTGAVTVIARLRPTEPRSTTGQPPAGQVTRIHLPTIDDQVPYPLYGAYADLETQEPKPEEVPQRIPAPEPAEGPHLAYAFQWFLFAGIALVGVGVLARREAADQTAGKTG
jgi:cytochrome oxidase assembly protein ShyY1